MKILKTILINNVLLSFLYNKIKRNKYSFVFVLGMTIEDIVYKVFDKECK